MNRLHGLATLMGAVILAIAGFQVYWLKDNYGREKKAVETRAQVMFKETIREMQDSVLQKKLRAVLKDTSGAIGFKRKPFDETASALPDPPRTARILHLLGEQLTVDSAAKKKGVMILDKNADLERKDNPVRFRFQWDSLPPEAVDEMVVANTKDRGNEAGRVRTGSSQRVTAIANTTTHDSLRPTITEVNTIFISTQGGDRFKIKIDSLLNDTVSLYDLRKTFEKKLVEQKLDIPFTVSLQPRQPEAAAPDLTRLHLTFESFDGYKLELGNAFSYLIRKISLPILFSVFLVGLTIFSFVLLYRSLLRQHRLAQMKNDLISNITHELKTPIATVGVAIEALKNFNAIRDPEKTREYLDISQHELQRLGLLVDKVLKLSMFENKKMDVSYELFDLEEAVNEVIASLRLQLEKYQARITTSTDGNLLMKADRMHLLSVVFNLLDNALKYSKGNAAIHLEIKEEAENIVMKVTDNGIGIPNQYKSKVFEKFFRVPTGDTHNAKGHGLGLSYVASVIRQHRGSITLDSHEGVGSTFTVVLPKGIGS